MDNLTAVSSPSITSRSVHKGMLTIRFYTMLEFTPVTAGGRAETRTWQVAKKVTNIALEIMMKAETCCLTIVFVLAKKCIAEVRSSLLQP